MKDAKDVKDKLDSIEFSDSVNVVNVVNVWSNGNKIRRYVSQDKNNDYSPENGYKKMVAILVEIDE